MSKIDNGRAVVRRPSRKQRVVSKNEVRQMIEARIHNVDELKYKTNNTTYSPSTSGTTTHLTSIAGGTTDSTRVGDAVTLESIEVRFNGLCASSVAGSTEINAIRMLLIQWHPVSNAAVTLADILLDNLAYWISPYDHDNQRAKLFTILRDETFSTDGYSRAGFTGHWMVNRGFQKKMCYIAGSSSNQSNGLYLMLVSDSSAVSHPAVNTYVKVNYTDA